MPSSGYWKDQRESLEGQEHTKSPMPSEKDEPFREASNGLLDCPMSKCPESHDVDMSLRGRFLNGTLSSVSLKEIHIDRRLWAVLRECRYESGRPRGWSFFPSEIRGLRFVKVGTMSMS